MTARSFSAGSTQFTHTPVNTLGVRRFQLVGEGSTSSGNTYKMRGYDPTIVDYRYWYTTNPNLTAPFSGLTGICIDAVIIGDNPTEL